jgi:hypothetical protein
MIMRCIVSCWCRCIIAEAGVYAMMQKLAYKARLTYIPNGYY